ncbi:MAG: HupE/UreJ family protein [Phycisphaeraceae bacterium]|nr:HupE/UreJ family protein [Phycisphaeraceae bacterium]
MRRLLFHDLGTGGAMVLICTILWAGPVRAHEMQLTRVDLTADTQVLTLRIELDLMRYLSGSGADHNDRKMIRKLAGMRVSDFETPSQRVRSDLKEHLKIRFDGSAVPLKTVRLPEADRLLRLIETAQVLQATGASAVQWDPVIFVVEGPVPEGAETVRVVFPESLGEVVASFRPARGQPSVPVPVGVGADWGPLPLTAGSGVSNEGPVLWRYLVFGFTHILPKGLDHILFVLGLFLLSVKMKPLLWQVTAFTAAHTITLGLAAAGWVNLPASVVEPIIALSIAVIAVENIVTDELKPWRPAVVFGFGLLHGLGFAGVLGEVGIPDEAFVPALLAFNVGVEIGQLAVIGLAFVLVGWFAQKPWYRRRVVIPASVLIGGMGLFWTVERIFF